MYLPIFNILGIGLLNNGQIDRALAMEGCEIQRIFRDRLRVDGKLTNCETGDRLVISKLLSKPIPRMLKIGKYIARVLYSNCIWLISRGIVRVL
jgi:hypothetical protein